MKRLLLIILCLLPVVLFAQKIRFTDSTNKWSVYVYSLGPPPSTVVYNYGYAPGETVINNYHYKKLSNYFFREDTVAGKVYILYNCNNQSHEEVYLDYNLQIGDTVTHIGCDTFIHVVAAIDSTVINGLTYRTWYFQTVYQLAVSANYVVVEGIGCVFGPQFISFAYDGLDEQLLKCFSSNDAHPILQPPVNAHGHSYYFDNYASCTLNTANLNKQFNDNALIGSNPANENTIITFPYNITNGELIIVNVVGQRIVDRPIHNTSQQTIGALPGYGLYFYKLLDKQSGRSFSGKFIYE